MPKYKGPEKHVTPLPCIYWRWHDSTMQKRRVWREGWGFDQFEIMFPDAFVQLLFVCTTFNVATVKQAEDDEIG